MCLFLRIGLGRDGDQAFLDVILDEFDLRRFLPADCPECLVRGHLTGVIGYFLARDTNTRVAVYSSWHDTVLARTFLKVDPEIFATSLAAMTDPLHSAYPDRFRRFITAGTQHTALLADATGIIGTDLGAVELPEGALGELLGGDLVIGGLDSTELENTTMGTWLKGFIDNDPSIWRDMVAPLP